MKRVKSNYHALHVLQTTEPRLRKAIVSNSKKDLVNSINESVLIVLNGNIKFTICSNRKLRKHKVALRKVADKRVLLSSKKKFIVQRGGFCLSWTLFYPRSLVSFSDRLIKTSEKSCYVKCISFRPTALNNPRFLLFQRRNRKLPS